MDIKKHMNQQATIKNGNIVAMLAVFTERFILQHTNVEQPLNQNIQNDLMADAISFVLSSDYEEVKNTKTNWDD